MTMATSAQESSIEARIQRLEDLQALRDLKSRYAYLADRIFVARGPASAAALADLFTEGAAADFDFLGRFTGRAQHLHAFEHVLPKGFIWSAHHMLNPLIEVHGDTATGSFYFLVNSRPEAPPGAPLTHFYGLYEDKFVRVGGTWKIADLVVRIDAPRPG